MATKYFFGYYSYHGIVRATSWLEDDGKGVGGTPHEILQKTEISEELWNQTLSVLAVLHPYEVVEPPTPVPE